MGETTLQKLIAELIASEEQKAIKLDRGLVLAFTPQRPDGPGLCRLVLSRRGVLPSHVEDNVVMLGVQRALWGMRDRVVVQRPWLRPNVPIRKGWGSNVITWRWVLSRDFWSMTDQERERGIRWEAERNAELRGGGEEHGGARRGERNAEGRRGGERRATRPLGAH